MSDEIDPKPSRYEILQIDDKNHSILRRKTNGSFLGSRRALEVMMPNVGSMDQARFIVDNLIRRDEESRKAAEQRDREFQESLEKPHVFTQASPRVELCYCGKPTGDPIHIPDPEEEK